jgi:serine/threonine protein phosphatase PrpC
MTDYKNEKLENICLKFRFDKIEGQGQDAEPTFILSENKGLLAVYDGLGSASTEYEYEEEKKASAYWASLFTKQITEALFADNSFNTQNFVAELQEQLKKDLKEKIRKLEKTPPKFKGNLANRRLPTTIAGLYFDLIENKLLIFWAGDSRCYLLNPNGLVQLTKDDIVTNSDALENLINDAPLSNFVNADTDFVINQYIMQLEQPCLLITATDGCFGYLESPAHFEYLMLKNLVNSFNIDHWKADFVNTLKQIAADDISLSLLAIGYNDFEKMKIDFQNRFIELETKFISPLDDFNRKILDKETSISVAKNEIEKLKTDKNELRKTLWEQYKQGYEPKIK